LLKKRIKEQSEKARKETIVVNLYSGRSKELTHKKSQYEQKKAIAIAFKKHPYESIGWSPHKNGRINAKIDKDTSLSLSAANVFMKNGSHPTSAKVVDISKTTGFKPSRLIVFEGYDSDGRAITELSVFTEKLEDQLDRQIRTDINFILDRPEGIQRVPSPFLRVKSQRYHPVPMDKESSKKFETLSYSFNQWEKHRLDDYLCHLPQKTSDYFENPWQSKARVESGSLARGKSGRRAGRAKSKLKDIKEENSLLSSIEHSLADYKGRRIPSHSEIENLREILPASAKQGTFTSNKRADSKFSSVLSLSPSRKVSQPGLKDRVTFEIEQIEKKIKKDIADIDEELDDMNNYIQASKRQFFNPQRKGAGTHESLPHPEGNDFQKNEIPHINSNEEGTKMAEDLKMVSKKGIKNLSEHQNKLTETVKDLQEYQLAIKRALRQDIEKGFRVNGLNSKSMLLGYNQRYRIQKYNKLVERLAKSNDKIIVPFKKFKGASSMIKVATDNVFVHETKDGVVKVSQNFDIRQLTSD
jgi:hypothetical protein